VPAPVSASAMLGGAPITITLKNANINIGKIILRRKANK